MTSAGPGTVAGLLGRIVEIVGFDRSVVLVDPSTARRESGPGIESADASGDPTSSVPASNGSSSAVLVDLVDRLSEHGCAVAVAGLEPAGASGALDVVPSTGDIAVVAPVSLAPARRRVVEEGEVFETVGVGDPESGGVDVAQLQAMIAAARERIGLDGQLVIGVVNLGCGTGLADDRSGAPPEPISQWLPSFLTHQGFDVVSWESVSQPAGTDASLGATDSTLNALASNPDAPVAGFLVRSVKSSRVPDMAAISARLVAAEAELSAAQAEAMALRHRLELVVPLVEKAQSQRANSEARAQRLQREIHEGEQRLVARAGRRLRELLRSRNQRP